MCVTITGFTLKWTSSTDVRSKLYSLKGATVSKTVQFRFQINNMTELRDPRDKEKDGSGSAGRDVAKK